MARNECKDQQHAENLDLEVLNPNRNLGYLPKRIPIARDGEIDDLLSRYIARRSVARLQRCMQEGNKLVLRAFAERMASAAIRNSSPGQLRLGLIALLLTLDGLDARDGLTILPLYYDAILRLRPDPFEFTESVRQIIGDRMAVPLTEFLKRADKSLKAMGFSEGADADGFRYVRNW